MGVAGGPIPLLGLTHVVHPEVRLQLAEGTFEPPPAGFSDVFVYQPARPFVIALAAQTSYRMIPVSEPDGLWRLEPRVPREPDRSQSPLAQEADQPEAVGDDEVGREVQGAQG